MATQQDIRLGLLSPATPNRPHFKHVDNLLPPGVSLIHEGLGLLGESYQDLAGKADQVIAIATDFVKRNEVAGLILTGGFIGLFNPGIDVKVSQAIRLPVATAVSSAVAALKVFAAKSVLLMTPFDAKSDAVIKDHLNVSILPFTLDRRSKGGKPAPVSILPPNNFSIWWLRPIKVIHQRMRSTFKAPPWTRCRSSRELKMRSTYR